MDCEHSSICLNQHQCYRCQDAHLLKLPKNKFSKKKPVRKSWEKLEQDVADKLSPTKESYRQAGSGNKWYAPGDIVDEILLLEAKERGTITSKGKKTISIEKEWIEKITEESSGSGKFPGVVFKFKDDNKEYVILNFNDLCTLIHELKILRKEHE